MIGMFLTHPCLTVPRSPHANRHAFSNFSAISYHFVYQVITKSHNNFRLRNILFILFCGDKKDRNYVFGTSPRKFSFVGHIPTEVFCMQLRGDLRWADLHGYLRQRCSDTTTFWLRKAFRALLNSRTFFAVFFFYEYNSRRSKQY